MIAPHEARICAKQWSNKLNQVCSARREPYDLLQWPFRRFGGVAGQSHNIQRQDNDIHIALETDLGQMSRGSENHRRTILAFNSPVLVPPKRTDSSRTEKSCILTTWTRVLRLDAGSNTPWRGVPSQWHKLSATGARISMLQGPYSVVTYRQI